MRKITSLFLALIFIIQGVLAGSFSDVSNDHSQYAAIESLKNLNIINGYEDGRFGPDDLVTRAQALKIILGSAKIEVPEISESEKISFPDVPREAWFARFVITSKKQDIVGGNPDGTFAPNRKVNKAEFLKMLLGSFKTDLSRHQNLTEGISSDTEVGQWFLPYLSYAKTLGIVTPTLNNELFPSKELTRGDCAEITYKMLVNQFGGDAQKLLSIAESNLVDLLVNLNNNNVLKAIHHADNAVFYTDEVLKLVPDDLVAKGAQKIAQGFKSLCLAYQAGVEQQHDKIPQYVTEADNFAEQAFSENEAFASLKEKIQQMGKVLLEQIE